MRREWAMVAAGLTAVGCGPLAKMCKGDPEWRVIKRTPADVGLVGERVEFVSRDHLRVTAWWMPVEGAKRSIVLVHGRGGNRSDMLKVAARLEDMESNVLEIDLRACGESEGEYPSAGHLEAAEVLAAAEWLHQRGAASPVVLMGHSMGGVAVLHAAATAPAGAIDGVIADGAFYDPYDMLDRIRGRVAKDPNSSVGERLGLWFASLRFTAPLVSWATTREAGVDLDPRLDQLERVLPRVTVPVLLVSGEQDDISPPEDALKIFRGVTAQSKQLVVVPRAPHQLFDDAPGEFEKAVRPFLDHLSAAPIAARDER